MIRTPVTGLPPTPSVPASLSVPPTGRRSPLWSAPPTSACTAWAPMAPPCAKSSATPPRR